MKRYWMIPALLWVLIAFAWTFVGDTAKEQTALLWVIVILLWAIRAAGKE